MQAKHSIEQTDPPRSPRETLPTMYDLPSEDPEEPGLPDEFHDLQPQLLSRTCHPPHYSPEWMFTGTDINLYYNVRHPRWYKRPDWFLVVGVPRLYDEIDLRLSYVIWQEGIAPRVVVELLSPGTETEDLGEQVRSDDLIQPSSEAPSTQEEPETAKNQKPPGKWEVYEQILRVPHYLVFSRYTNRMRAFTLVGDRYQEIAIDSNSPRVWIPSLELGLGLWQGPFEGIERLWLRWYDAEGNWLLTDTELALEQAQQERQRAEVAEQRANIAEQRAETAEQRAEQLAQRLRDLGIDP